MHNRRTLGVFSAAFAVVLLAGISFAQVGTWTPEAPEPTEVAFAPGPTVGSAPTTLAPSTVATGPAGSAAQTTSLLGSAVTEPALFLITFPKEGDRFDDQYVTFEGVAPIGWTVTAAGYEADRDGKGGWSIRLILSPGRNDATLYATSPDGAQVLQASVTAYYDVPSAAGSSTTTAEENAGSATFTAHQKYGEGDGSHPFDVFWGEGTPGDTIRASSDYGRADTRVGPKGFWDMRVVFREAPAGETFVVVLEDGSGTQYSFTFIRLGHDDDDEDSDEDSDQGNREDDGEHDHDGDDTDGENPGDDEGDYQGDHRRSGRA